MAVTYSMGVCPKCHSLNLTYGKREIDDNNILYPFTCDDCGAKGQEVYDILFSYSEAPEAD